MLLQSQVPQTITRPLRPLSISSTGGSSGLVESSPATVGALQSKVMFPKQVSIIKTTSSASKEKKAYVSVRLVGKFKNHGQKFKKNSFFKGFIS